MNVQIFTLQAGSCPYLPDREWQIHRFEVPLISSHQYEAMLSKGWRRNSQSIYQNCCPGCGLCLPIRIDTQNYTPSKSQRRIIRKNQDLQIQFRDPEYRDEVFELYWRYQQTRHPGSNEASLPLEIEQQAFREFFCQTNLSTQWMEYRTSSGKLIGLGLVDVLPQSLSSVYFVFDPREESRSLGSFSIISEILQAAATRRPWLHLGFWVPGSPKMQYKADYFPQQILGKSGWMWRHKKTDPVPLPRIRSQVEL